MQEQGLSFERIHEHKDLSEDDAESKCSAVVTKSSSAQKKLLTELSGSKNSHSCHAYHNQHNYEVEVDDPKKEDAIAVETSCTCLDLSGGCNQRLRV